MNRQGNDIGDSYRSAIFYTSDKQRTVADDTIADVNAPGPLVPEGRHPSHAAGDFWEAEPGHQDYLERLPDEHKVLAGKAISFVVPIAPEAPQPYGERSAVSSQGMFHMFAPERFAQIDGHLHPKLID